MSDRMTPEEIAALREERDRLLSERDAATHRADEEARRADTLHGQVISDSRRLAESAVQGIQAQEQQAEAAIGTINAEITGLKGQYAALLAEGKFEEAADVQEKISDAAARRNATQQAKGYYAQQREQAKAMPADPVERFFHANPQFTDGEREWIRRNPRYATDRDFQERVNAAHAAATDKGLPRGSEGYFAELERAGYMRSAPVRTAPAAAPAAEPDPDNNSPFSEAALEPEEPVQPPPRPRTATAAPPSRRAPTAPAPRRVVAELTAEQADTALKNADLAPIEIQNQGDAAILQWWSELNHSSAAQRLRQEWAGG